MDLALVLSALLMGLAGTPHCVLMCGPACAALGASGRRETLAPTLALHAGRVVSYGAVGALAAGGVSLLGAVGATATWLRPLWTLVHAAALGLGLWLLVTGRQPAWVERIGRGVSRRPAATPQGAVPIAWHAAARNAGAGALWAAWPCGLLQSVIVVAALANGPFAGAAVMGAFAVASALGLVIGPMVWFRLSGARASGEGTALAGTAWAVRLAGLMLAGAASWALGHGLWMRVIDYCFG